MLFAFHDFETSGLTKHPKAPLEDQPRAIEYACILHDGKREVDRLEFICNPGLIIEEVITKITGLTNQDLVDKPPFNSFVSDIGEILKSADIIVAHNQSFDKAIMEYNLAMVGKSLSDVNWPRLELCTVEQTFHQFGRYMKLSELYEMFIGPYEQKHRAADDVELLIEVAKSIGIFEMFRG